MMREGMSGGSRKLSELIENFASLIFNPEFKRMRNQFVRFNHFSQLFVTYIFTLAKYERNHRGIVLMYCHLRNHIFYHFCSAIAKSIRKKFPKKRERPKK